jgi:hypothetical protein
MVGLRLTFVHSLEFTSCFVVSTYHVSWIEVLEKTTLKHRNHEIREDRRDFWSLGGVAKPGQTRRTQDQNRRSRPLGVRGFESHPLHQGFPTEPWKPRICAKLGIYAI